LLKLRPFDIEEPRIFVQGRRLLSYLGKALVVYFYTALGSQITVLIAISLIFLFLLLLVYLLLKIIIPLLELTLSVAMGLVSFLLAKTQLKFIRLDD